MTLFDDYLKALLWCDQARAERDAARLERDHHASALDQALFALAGASVATPEEGFRRAPPGQITSCIGELRKERDAAVRERDQKTLALDAMARVLDTTQDQRDEAEKERDLATGAHEAAMVLLKDAEALTTIRTAERDEARAVLRDWVAAWDNAALFDSVVPSEKSCADRARALLNGSRVP